jgi:DHA2 family methylenomycin A resistance protein-like MFS transporter
MSTAAMSAVDSSRAGQASALVNAARQVGQVFGVAVLGALVYAGLPGGSGTGRQLTPAQQSIFVAGLHHALWVAGLALLAAAALTLLLFTGNRQQAPQRLDPGQYQSG